MKTYDLTVVVEKNDEGDFLAICPALQGCYADGENMGGALAAIEEGIKPRIQSRLEHGELIPEEIYSSQLKIAV